MSKDPTPLNERVGLSITDAAAALSIHPSTLHRLINRGVVPVARLGRIRRVSVATLEELLRGGELLSQQKDRAGTPAQRRTGS